MAFNVLVCEAYTPHFVHLLCIVDQFCAKLYIPLHWTLNVLETHSFADVKFSGSWWELGSHTSRLSSYTHLTCRLRGRCCCLRLQACYPLVQLFALLVISCGHYILSAGRYEHLTFCMQGISYTTRPQPADSVFFFMQQLQSTLKFCLQTPVDYTVTVYSWRHSQIAVVAQILCAYGYLNKCTELSKP